jgi:hypothetical protein
MIFHLSWSLIEPGAEEVDKTVGDTVPAVDPIGTVKRWKLILTHLRPVFITDLRPHYVFGFGPGITIHAEDSNDLSGTIHSSLKKSSVVKGLLSNPTICRFVVMLYQIGRLQNTDKGFKFQVATSAQW